MVQIDSQTVYDEEHIIELRNDGFTIVEVVMPSLIRATVIQPIFFGEDEDGSPQFFLVVSNYENGWLGFGAELRGGLKAAIKYD